MQELFAHCLEGVVPLMEPDCTAELHAAIRSSLVPTVSRFRVQTRNTAPPWVQRREGPKR